MLAICGIALALAVFGVTPARAHGDHGAAPVGPIVIAPRAEARAGVYELVAVFSKNTLAVFVNRFADSAPVVGAKIEVSTDLQSEALAESDPGVYTTRALLFVPGGNPIEIKLAIDETSLTQGLTVALPDELSDVHETYVVSTLVKKIGAAALLVVALMVGGMMVVRRSSRSHDTVSADAD